MLASLLNLYRILAWSFALVGGSLSLLLMKVSLSRLSLIFGVASLLISLAPLLDATGRARESRTWKRLALLCLVGWLGLVVWLWRQAPDGKPAAGARVENRYLNGQWHYPHATLGNLIPELDQILLGLSLVPAVDPLLTSDQAAKVEVITKGIYAELEAVPDFHALGTVLPHAYDDLWTGRTNHGHYFLYIPARLDRSKAAPAMIFLHGSGGNFKAYAWILSKVAEDLGIILIAPSFGMGDWEEPGTSRTLRGVIEDAAAVIPVDRRNIHLVGLSNGGLGVSQAPLKMGGEIRSLFLISPVLDQQAIRSAQFLDYGQTHRIGILTGAKDKRVPLLGLHDSLAVLRSNGVGATLEALPDADHFMLFTHRDQVLSRISLWLRAAMTAPPVTVP